MKHERPTALVEVLRLAVVVFCAVSGYELGKGLAPHDAILGPLDGVAVGVILGSFIGYVLGGVLGRSTLDAVDVTTHRLRDVSAERLLAGAVGTIISALGAAALAWPIFLAPEQQLTIPVFAFVVITLGLLGSRLGVARHHTVMALVGARPGGETLESGLRARVIDASVAVDGRVLDVVRAGFLAGPILLPDLVLTGLETDAAGANPTRAARARRALTVLDRLRREPDVEVEVLDGGATESTALGKDPGSDPGRTAILTIAHNRKAIVLTADAALARAAQDAGLRVQDINGLATALRSPISAGDEIDVLLVRSGKDPGQAVGFLDDGTMVVAEKATSSIGSDVTVRVTSVLLSAKGRMAFGQLV